MSLKYRIFIIFHDTLNLQYYNKSILRNIVFINVREGNKNRYPELNIINLHELKNFIPIGSYYAESEVVYNLYKNTYLIDDIDFVGFLHHDIDCSPLTDDIIQTLITTNKLISFETHLFKADYNQNILMDAELPNELCGVGKNCYETIFQDYNSFNNTHHLLPDFYEINNEIILCSCFLVHKEVFYDLMEFSSGIIESKKLNGYDIKHKHRIQGGFMERYYATWFMLKKIPIVSIKLHHYFFETEKRKPLIEKLAIKIKRLLKTIYGTK